MLSEGVTVEAIGREDERAWKPPARAAEHDLSAAQGLKSYMTSERADHLQYVKKITAPPGTFGVEEPPRKDVSEDAPPASFEQLIADIEAEPDEEEDAA